MSVLNHQKGDCFMTLVCGIDEAGREPLKLALRPHHRPFGNVRPHDKRGK